MKIVAFNFPLYRSTRILVAACIAFLGTLTLEAADARGKQLYINCVACHGPDGNGSKLLNAPAINNLSEKHIVDQLNKFHSGMRGGDVRDITGLQMRPMAQVLQNDEDRAAVAKYVASLESSPKEATLEGGDPVKGQAFYAVCLACHGPDAKGNDLLNSPSLIHQYDWYQLAQLKKFKDGIRGGNPQDITGAQMRPMAMTLVDEAAMKDVIAYIQTLSK